MPKRNMTVTVCSLPWTVEFSYEQGSRSVFAKEKIDPDDPPELSVESISLGTINMDEFLNHDVNCALYDCILDAVRDSIARGD